MSLHSELRTRLRALFARRDLEREMNDELQDYVEREVAAWRTRGVDEVEARRRALASFGGIEQAREAVRDERGLRFVEDLARDVRLGLRTLLRRPLFFGTAVVTLGLGIAVATSIFSVVSLLLLRPLDARDPDRLVAFGHNSRTLDGPSPSLSFPMVTGMRGLDVFDGVLAQSNETVSIADQGRDDARVLYGNAVTGNYFTMLGISPAAGRFFDEAEERGRDQVVVLSNRLWTTRYGRDPSVVGRIILMNGLPFTVVGVTPSTWHGIEHLVDAQFFYPIALRQLVSGSREDALTTHASFLRVLARLAPGRTLQDARNQLEAFAAAHAPERGLKAGELSFLVQFERRARPVIVIANLIPAIAGTFLGLAALALLIACVNVGNLVLARTLARTGELAIRRSLGASRGRVLRQLLAESLILGLSALAVAIPVAYGVVQWIASLQLSADIPLLIDVRLDRQVLAFAAGVASLAGLFTGLAPALRGSSDRVAVSLREDTRGSTSTPGRRRLGSALLAGQLAFSLILVIAGALFTRSLRTVTSIDLGLDPDRLAMATVDLSLNRYSPARARAFFQRAEDAFAALPGVEAVAHLRDAPMGFSTSFSRIEHIDKSPIGQSPSLSVQVNDFTPGAFAALKLRLLDGRAFDQHDDSAAPRRVIVNPQLAQRLFPGSVSVVGRRFRFTSDSQPLEIIGVIGAMKSEFPTENPQAQLFRPYAQAGGPGRTFFVRVRGEVADVLPAMGRILHQLDPEVAVNDLRPMHDFLHNGKAFFLYRIASTLTLAIGALGVLQTLVGLYGVVAYLVSQRAREFGIRVALGAAKGQLVRQVMRPAVAQVGFGSAIGVVVAALALPAAGTVLAVSPRDPLTYLACTAVLVGLALGALYIPARRAANAEPMQALRGEG